MLSPSQHQEASAPSNIGARRPPQAVFCVCSDPDVVQLAATTTATVPGFLFAGAFGDYITADKRPQFPPSMKAAGACVALVDFDRDAEQALRTVERLNEIFARRIRLVAMGTELPSPLLLRAVRAGCVEILNKPLRADELENALHRFEESVASNAVEKGSTGRVFAFFGAKGGVGTTTLAVHLATHLVRTHGCRTLIIDHKHQLGHVALYLGLNSTKYHFDDLLRNVDRLDAELLGGFALRHGSGLDVLASPDQSQEQFVCEHGEIEIVMDFLRREYDCILIDSSIVYERASASIIEQADEVFLVSTADVASLRDLARLVEHIQVNPAAVGKLHLAINRSTANESITAEQIHQAVRTAVKFSVPNNFLELLQSVNHGEPIAPGPHTPFNSAIADWAAHIVGDRDGRQQPASVKATEKRSIAFWRTNKGEPRKWLKFQYS